GRPPDPHLHQDRRRRHHRPRRHEPHVQDRGAPRCVRRRGRGQQLARRGAGARGPRSRGRRRAAGGAERPVRPRGRPVHSGGARSRLPAAARDRGLHRAARGALRRLQRPPGQARQLHPARRHPCGRAAARLAHRGAPRRAVDVGAARGRAGEHEPRAGALPQPPVGPAVHPVADRQPRRRRPVAARRRPAGLRL
ncbi:MAG: ATP:Cob(I)alamin adenosyltransferase, partial [uncultured Frankineae bacterium]